MKKKISSWILALPIMGVLAINLGTLALFFYDGAPEDGELPTYDGPSTQMDTSTKLILAAICFAFVVLAVSAIAILIVHNLRSLQNPKLECAGMLIIKLGLIPFYIGGGLLCVVFAVIPATAILSFFFGIIGWFIMLTGSVWAVCYAFSLRKMGGLKTGATLLFIIMQLIMVLDVISAIIIAVIGRRCGKVRKLNEAGNDIAVDARESI